MLRVVYYYKISRVNIYLITFFLFAEPCSDETITRRRGGEGWKIVIYMTCDPGL